MRIWALMVISTIAVSGLYVGITIMPMLGGVKIPRAQEVSPPVVPVQTSHAERPATGDGARAPSQFLPFPAEAQFETGDTWISGGRRYRLYGLQACLRGTSITISGGAVRDCGELNVIMTQALIRDTRPVCTNIKDIDGNNAVVACQTTAGQHRYDLATYMIAQGWGFAAVDGAGHLIVPGYRVAEESARSVRAGLWAYSDLPDPVSILAQQAGVPR
ncbi:thermonuclease family protein [Neorhizobium galegae]|uniref:thermonuclease family protein n=1 Tax=Neorhizobium galegae TaxID=399 RepID=UPI000622581C|nr:thermonuclease family protein [Neorhizobium galegae]MCQ1768137.1 thermonuclease family protein [Neorhizobium galegae]MCQ1847109.1 thermonuclease family protein [Neorhizobium galegae]CDZ29954.1 Succinoglycan biosynthesis protein ExoI-like protein [Neorhizobium galegae bv. officinalis]